MVIQRSDSGTRSLKKSPPVFTAFREYAMLLHKTCDDTSFENHYFQSIVIVDIQPLWYSDENRVKSILMWRQTPISLTLTMCLVRIICRKASHHSTLHHALYVRVQNTMSDWARVFHRMFSMLHAQRFFLTALEYSARDVHASQISVDERVLTPLTWYSGLLARIRVLFAHNHYNSFKQIDSGPVQTRNVCSLLRLSCLADHTLWEVALSCFAWNRSFVRNKCSLIWIYA